MDADLPCFVLDSFALLSHLQNEGRGGRVVDLLEQAQRRECRLLMSLVNLGEICYLIEVRRGLRTVQLTLAAIESLPVEILPADQEAVFTAAHLKAQYPISFADAFAAAASQAHSATLVTGDPEFKALISILKLEWLVR